MTTNCGGVRSWQGCERQLQRALGCDKDCVFACPDPRLRPRVANVAYQVPPLLNAVTRAHIRRSRKYLVRQAMPLAFDLNSLILSLPVNATQRHLAQLASPVRLHFGSSAAPQMPRCLSSYLNPPPPPQATHHARGHELLDVRVCALVHPRVEHEGGGEEREDADCAGGRAGSGGRRGDAWAGEGFAERMKD